MGLGTITSMGCIVADIHEEVAMPTVTGTPFAHPPCMKDDKSHCEMAPKNPSGSDGGSPATFVAEKVGYRFSFKNFVQNLGGGATPIKIWEPPNLPTL